MNTYQTKHTDGAVLTVEAPTIGQALALASKQAGKPVSSWAIMGRKRSPMVTFLRSILRSILRDVSRPLLFALAATVGALAVFLVSQL